MRVAFSGSRHLGPEWAPAVGALVASLPAGAVLLVGDAAGADALVRQAAPAARIFAAASRRPADLVARSVRLARAAAADPTDPAWFVALADAPCPPGIAPAPHWSSGRPPSGTWSSAALAAGLGVPVLAVWCAAGSAQLPAWPGGWTPAAALPWTPALPLAAPCFVWTPATLPLF